MKEMQISKIKTLLGEIKKIIFHQKEIERLKGETFNIFSILGLESNENKTHSAFICELLNPKGSHLKGDTFLRLFLQIINNDRINLQKAKIVAEKHIGKRDDISKSGGRIDIFIYDNQGNNISIENKIYAADQDTQIERYCNYNKKKNTVYYLTLFGNSPSIESKGELIDNKDYYIISYKEHISAWLKLCVKETVNDPILRETIKQYQILVNKLTSTMDTKTEKEIISVILKNYEEASYISKKFTNTINSITENIRQEVFNQLKQEIDSMDNKYSIQLGSSTQKVYSQIWIRPSNTENGQLIFGLESFSGRGNLNGNLFVGVFNTVNKVSLYSGGNYDDKISRWWMDILRIPEFDGLQINLSNPIIIRKLFNDQKFHEDFVNHIVSKVLDYLNTETAPLLDFLNSK